MGVELGKVLAKNILSQLGKPEDVKGHDSSVCLCYILDIYPGMIMDAFLFYQTTGLIHYYQKFRKE